MVKIWDILLTCGWFCVAIYVTILIIIEIIPPIGYLVVIAFLLSGVITSAIILKYYIDSKKTEGILEQYESGNLDMGELIVLAQEDLTLYEYFQDDEVFNQFQVMDGLDLENLPEGKMICLECGEIIEEGLDFCPECGNRIPKFLQYNIYSISRRN